LQCALVQGALAQLPICLKCHLYTTIPHLQIGCMNQKFSLFSDMYCSNIGISDEPMASYFHGFQQTLQK
jgi:hypothetical protein